ncbi:hypothetical protein HDU80_001245, partial [Chytriomyces hyalinus]
LQERENLPAPLLNSSSATADILWNVDWIRVPILVLNLTQTVGNEVFLIVLIKMRVSLLW